MSAELETELARETLVVSDTSSGRWVKVVTYLEGGTHPIESGLLFRSAAMAAECARVLSEAKAVQ